MNVSFKQIWDLLARHIAPQRNRFVLLTLLLLGSIGLQVINPQIARAFIDASSSQAAETLAAAALAFIGIALFQQAVGVAATYVGENVAWTATNALRAEIARHCLSLDMAFHDAHAPGEMVESKPAGHSNGCWSRVQKCGGCGKGIRRPSERVEQV